MEKKSRDIFIVVETNHGSINKSNLELITAANFIKDSTHGKITALVLGHETDPITRLLSRYEIDRIIIADDEALAEYSTKAYTDTLYAVISEHEPDAVLISANRNGKDFAPRLARRLSTGITANCVEISVQARTGVISWHMPAPGGIMATILCPDSRPQMGTVCPGAFAAPTAGKEKEVEKIHVTARISQDSGIKIIGRRWNKVSDGKELADAEIIVAGGRGIGSRENFELIKELAGLLGAAAGASRAAVDEEFAEPGCLIGQTGKVVRPKLYIAFGISGALQHMIGVKDAECIVAVNSDKNAPIFEVADYAVVGDAKKILSALIDQLKNR